jgi:hypothetical protein
MSVKLLDPMVMPFHTLVSLLWLEHLVAVDLSGQVGWL